MTELTKYIWVMNLRKEKNNILRYYIRTDNMKKLFTLCIAIAISATLLCGCTGKKSNSTGADKSGDSSHESNSISTEHKTPPNVSEESYKNVGDFNVYIPDGFKPKAEPRVMINSHYFSYSKEFGNNTIYFNFDELVRYDGDLRIDGNPIKGIELKDVPENTGYRIKNGINSIFDDNIRGYEITVDLENKETVNNMPFINQTGSINLELWDDAGSGMNELSYTAYYTLLGSLSSKENHRLVSLIIFSDSFDNETKAEMDRIAQEIIKYTDWYYFT